MKATLADVDNQLRFAEPAGMAAPCRRQLMERIPSRMDPLGGFTPQVERFPVGGVSSRCDKAVYKQNPTGSFVNSAPLPLPSRVLTGVFSPGLV
ncbi:MAG: hypothetical protein EOO40_04565 [Deltaproteobacteria bacterium]|nr:MAG: hypothetical protein EOO40_04565 [Deltaproteobacteria bacterium]